MAYGEKEKMKNFYSFEGIDGSGKSTISKIVYKKLKKKGLDVVLTREPTDSWIGKKVQEYIESGEDPYLTTITFIADRIEHGKQIKQWVDEGKIVLCDRYAESTYAYQAVQLEKDIDDPVFWLKDLSKNRFPLPEKTFLFVIKPKDSLARIQHRDNLIPFEKIEFLNKVHENYLKICKGPRFYKVDANKSKEELVDLCLDKIIK